MPTDAALFALTKPLESGQAWPRPVCPTCRSGYIGFEEPAATQSFESTSSIGHPMFEPSWVKGTFTVRGECENQSCRQAIHGSGDFRVNESDKSEDEQRLYEGVYYSEYYSLVTLHPAIDLLTLPEAAPDQIRDGVRLASRVFFTDHGLAATALRGTVERFLTTAGVLSKTPNGKFRTLADRLEEWEKAGSDHPRIKPLLTAIRWLGNEGTHEDSKLERAEVITGIHVLDDAFHRIFVSPEIDLQAQGIAAARTTGAGPSPGTGTGTGT